MAEEPTTNYLDDVQARMNKILQRSKKSTNALLVLSQTFIIREQFSRADSLLGSLAESVNPSNKVLNDIGVLSFQQGEYHEAENYFERCIVTDPTFLEPIYNLSLTKEKLNKLDQAIELMQRYIDLEKNEEWNRVAQSKLKDYLENKNDYSWA